ncbi:MAG: VWA domain-containing protein [Treponema sp.]|nr:VWA domain-containing protein [Treponema sp.]
MKKGLTEIVFILDKSGSMSGLEKDTIGGYNSFLKKQKEVEGEAFVSTVFFDDYSSVIHDRVDIKEITPLTEDDYCPGGCTALLDAIGGAIHHIGNIHKYAREEDVPEKTVFVIITDGQENASHQFAYTKIKQMIERQKEKYNWEFLFLGANIDAIAEAAKIGINMDRAVQYECDETGTMLNFETMANAVHELRCCEEIPKGWKADIEQYQKKKLVKVKKD